jgi:hypothetical protein
MSNDDEVNVGNHADEVDLSNGNEAWQNLLGETAGKI